MLFLIKKLLQRKTITTGLSFRKEVEMKSNELNEKDNAFKDALDEQDNAKLAKAFEDRFKTVEANILQKFEELKDEQDENVLASRGVRRLTNAEKEFYKSIKDQVGNNPTKGATTVIPKTIINAVYEDLKAITTDNPLALIDLENTSGVSEWLVSLVDSPIAAWGELTEGITKELNVGFKVFGTETNKLSCYLPFAKSILDLGYEWIDAFLRQYMTLAIKTNLTTACISGNGQKCPYGMAYDYDTDSDTGTIKTAVDIKAIDKKNFGPLFKTLRKSPITGKTRALENPTIFVDSDSYYDYLYTNDSIINAKGEFVSMLDNLGVKVCVCETGLEEGQAILAMPKRYWMGFGSKKGGQEGTVEFSDDFLFLEDKRVYKVKTYADGFLKDKNGAILLNLKTLNPIA